MKIRFTIEMKHVHIGINELDEDGWESSGISVWRKKGIWRESMCWDPKEGLRKYRTASLPDYTYLHESWNKKEGWIRYFGQGMSPVRIN